LLLVIARPGIDMLRFRMERRGETMLSYVYFGTNDLTRAIEFYDAALSALGMQRCRTGDPEWDRVSAGWGIYEDDGMRELAFWVGTPFNQQPATAGNGGMVAFRASSWKAVDDFYAAALARGGVCDGAPGLRLQYSPDFYAAYVRDLDGNKVAAVCRGFTESDR
jgi:catechol 2,3-dioxygenase-like lactoylglutathione lyase family enzyme